MGQTEPNKNVSGQRPKSFWTKKNIVLGSVFAVVLLLIVVFASLFVFNIDFGEIARLSGQSQSGGKEGFLIGLIVAYVYQWFWNSFAIFYNARKYRVSAKWYEWIVFGAIILFINGITPFSLGSEPYKVYWLTRHGINNRDALLIVSSVSVY